MSHILIISFIININNTNPMIYNGKPIYKNKIEIENDFDDYQ
jgi:hypothetical protein